ncbi:VWA domain-containing protein [Spirillospora sp. CA-294931]|uniref:VWA domain-containing protein n=1 Tax=Spirillospora sp. CA-294931 TaxID=3240042 RepID=UPI003D8C0342
MKGYYKDGTVQHLAEQALGLCAHLDDDGRVPIVFFDTVAHPPIEVSLDDYEGRIAAEHKRLGHLGTTNYTAAMQTVIKRYQASGATAPAFVIFQTDGGPNNKGTAQEVLCESSTLPIFWQFVGFGDNEFRFLKKLDELPVPTKRAVDNAGFFEAGQAPRSLTDTTLYNNLLSEYPRWLSTARTQGIVT